MYVISEHTCLSIVIVTMYFLYVFYFVTILFFLIGNYLHFNVNTSSNGSSNKVYSSYICVLIYCSTKSTVTEGDVHRCTS